MKDTMISRHFSIDQCKKNSKTLFIFGCNDLRSGGAGQAVIRECTNAIGIRTKKLPSMEKDAFFTDDEYDENVKRIDDDIIRVKEYAEEIGATAFCFPVMGLGGGLAKLPIVAPKTFFYLCTRLYEEFNFNNLEGHFTI